jgi:hypothetical protein
MNQITTTRDAGLCFVIWNMLRNKTGSMLALENKKTTIMVFFVKLRALVSSWQKETKLNSYKSFIWLLFQ